MNRYRNRQDALRVCKLILENALRFLFNLAFISAFQALFGVENTLAGVAVGVGLTMFPTADLGIRPWPMAGIAIGLYVGSGLVAQLALASPWIALPGNFLFVFVIMLLSNEPVCMKPSISFLLCFVFCQATPVSADALPKRMLGLAAGGAVVAAATWICWRFQGYGRAGRGLRQQALAGWKRKGILFRMSFGLAAAMLAGMALHLKKPLWISIVVMSLTQLDFQQTWERIKYRTAATIAGIGVFVLVFRILIPEQYAPVLVLFMGYLSFFTNEYRYKQVVNSVCAINASLVLLDTTSAIQNRFLCLLGGIAIVLLLFLIQHFAQSAWKRLAETGVAGKAVQRNQIPQKSNA